MKVGRCINRTNIHKMGYGVLKKTADIKPVKYINHTKPQKMARRDDSSLTKLDSYYEDILRNLRILSF